MLLGRVWSSSWSAEAVDGWSRVDEMSPTQVGSVCHVAAGVPPLARIKLALGVEPHNPRSQIYTNARRIISTALRRIQLLV